jgi:hypothetical protein
MLRLTMMERSELKEPLFVFKELRVTRTSSRISRGTTADEGDFVAQHSPRHVHSMQAPQSGLHKQQQESGLLQPLVMQFSIMLQVCRCILLSLNIHLFFITVVSAVVVS